MLAFMFLMCLFMFFLTLVVYVYILSCSRGSYSRSLLGQDND